MKKIKLNLWVHDERFSKQDLILHPDLLFEAGQLLELSQDDKKVILSVQSTSLDNDIILKQPQFQISISQTIASQFEFQARADVYAKRIDEQSVHIDFLELSFRDQYIGRTDMWRLKLALASSAVYVGKKVYSLGIRAQIKDIYVNGVKSASGYVTERTRIIYRSETAKYFIFLQMSREMWEFDEDGDLFVEKCARGFLPDLFQKWKVCGANHVVSIILFTRILYPNPSPEGLTFSKELGGAEKHLEKESSVSVNSFGQYYRDYYRVVIDWETKSDWSLVLPSLKNEFAKFQKDILERKNAMGSTILSGTNH